MRQDVAQIPEKTRSRMQTPHQLQTKTGRSKPSLCSLKHLIHTKFSPKEEIRRKVVGVARDRQGKKSQWSTMTRHSRRYRAGGVRPGIDENRLARVVKRSSW